MMNRIFGAAVVVTLFALRPLPAAAQLSDVSIKVEGISCALCAATVEKNLRAVPGMAAVRIAEAEGAAYVRLKPGVAFEPELLRAAIEKGGEKVRGFTIELCGLVTKENGRVIVQLPGPNGQRFAVRTKATDDLGSMAPRTGVCVKGKVASTTASLIEIEPTLVTKL